MLIAHSALEHNGDAALGTLRELWPSLSALMDYFDRRSDPKTGLLLAGARGDWIPPASQTLHTPRDIVAAFIHTLCVAHS